MLGGNPSKPWNLEHGSPIALTFKGLYIGGTRILLTAVRVNYSESAILLRIPFVSHFK